MRKSIILVLFLFLNLSTWGLETKGQLTIDTKRTTNGVVGETYSAVLTLVPFNLDMITSADLENKTFLDYFYISRVIAIKASENNIDAIQVFMDIVIAKKFENQSFKIWSLHDRNIPVSFNLGKISKTDMIIKKFITFDTSLNEQKKWNLKILLTGLLILLVGSGFYYKIRRKKMNRSKFTVDVARELRVSKGHRDFEWIYRNRKTLSHYMEGKPASLQEFEELTRLIEEYQFQPSWHKRDISELIAKKNKVLESYRNGV